MPKILLFVCAKKSAPSERRARNVPGICNLSRARSSALHIYPAQDAGCIVLWPRSWRKKSTRYMSGLLVTRTLSYSVLETSNNAGGQKYEGLALADSLGFWQSVCRAVLYHADARLCTWPGKCNLAISQKVKSQTCVRSFSVRLPPKVSIQSR